MRSRFGPLAREDGRVVDAAVAHMERCADWPAPGAPGAMNRHDADILYDVYRRALLVLAEAEEVLFDGSDDPDRFALQKAHGDVLTAILFEIRHPIVKAFPGIDAVDRKFPEGPGDDVLSPSEEELVSRLSAEQVSAVDAGLLSGCTRSWRKVARIVSMATDARVESLSSVPFGFFVRRIAVLVEQGHLESQGDVAHARFSEVRLRRAG